MTKKKEQNTEQVEAVVGTADSATVDMRRIRNSVANQWQIVRSINELVNGLPARLTSTCLRTNIVAIPQVVGNVSEELSDVPDVLCIHDLGDLSVGAPPHPDSENVCEVLKKLGSYVRTDITGTPTVFANAVMLSAAAAWQHVLYILADVELGSECVAVDRLATWTHDISDCSMFAHLDPRNISESCDSVVASIETTTSHIGAMYIRVFGHSVPETKLSALEPELESGYMRHIPTITPALEQLYNVLSEFSLALTSLE